MLFCTPQFYLFFLIVFAVYWSLPWHRARILLLLAASIYFYASWNPWLALLICASTSLDYVLARHMDVSASPRRRRLLLTVSIVANLGLLCYFKYANFFLRSVQESLHAAGMEASLPVLQVILPIGISFYTFEAINYMVDVYRRYIRAERNLAHFMLFILFFPHLVAGPIVRARDFLPQIRRPKHWDWVRVHVGVQLFLWGLFKKLAVADRLALFCTPVFNNPEPYSSGATWLAVIAFAFQVYCDFSAYTDMALGCAHLLGYKLAPNFDRPYLAPNIAELWRRWHISLSSWLRDYLFIPLGGSRGGTWKTHRNLIITMTLAGLWHGASWTFVTHGFVQGLWMMAHRSFRTWCRQRARLTALLESLPGTALRVVCTFLGWSITLVIFRAPSNVVGDAGAFRIIGQIYHHLFVPGLTTLLPRLYMPTLCLVALMAGLHLIAQRAFWQRWTYRMPAPLLGLSYSLLLSATLLLATQGVRNFIYFDF
jgi:alginate O-acetyltransferase complex protein AlgI